MSNSASGQRPAIEAQRVSKDFFLLENASVWDLLSGRHELPAHRALHDVTLSVPHGEIVGVLGNNGAGKSTLLRTLGGIYAPSAGLVTLHGDVSAIFELGVASNEFLSGREYALRTFEQMSGPADDRQVYLAEVEEFAELGEHFDKPVKTYSAGMKARLFFAVATSFRKSIFLIDEVLSVGDSYFRARCWQRMRDFKRRGVSGILATHDWSSVLKLCERCYVLDHGKVALSGDSYPVVRQYLGLEQDFERADVWLTDALPTSYRGRPFEELQLSFPLHADDKTVVSILVSLELTDRTVGWENVMLLDPQEAVLEKGENTVSVRIPHLPLVPGSYMLHIGVLRRTPGTGEVVTLDARTWYHGNSLSLVIEGDETPGVASLNLVGRVRRRSP
ncbi:ABC transporter ATP-binding protein [Bosea robiniae]|uniref:Lipopolysaccharide transport system ATP-binding protein n=1 Tax=Bosea robiniae TaxID=1036780 RepID=A0ABY0P1W6_9HYPH|nr:ABC transporter ATP-binding protein [Bosea robiniae]SDG79064.1 lipopolysaccharide transport system ATP-binding protein [Bosea robiniae]